jgi:hypothetical protein
MNEIDRIWTALEVMPGDLRFSQNLVDGLPLPAQRYLLYSLAPGALLASSVQLTMRGSIRPGKIPWMKFTAHQILTPPLGFVWKVRAQLGPVVITGADLYSQREGRTAMRLLGLIPLINAGGPDVSKSAIGRLAGESVLLPSSLLPQERVRWQAMDDERAIAEVSIDGNPTAITLSVDSEGRLRDVSLKRWGNLTESGQYDYIPFGVRFDEERTFGGFTIPTRLRAGWWFGTDRHSEFFRAHIEKAAFS